MKTIEILTKVKAFNESATSDILGMRLAKFERAKSNREMWEAFDRILLLLKEEANFNTVNELENAEHRIFPDAEETAEAAYKAGLLAGAAQAFVAVYDLFPIPKKIDAFKNGDSTYNCSVFGEHRKCRGCGCECHSRKSKEVVEGGVEK